jgi:hypothetical protein
VDRYSYLQKLNRADEGIETCEREIAALLANKPYIFTDKFDTHRGHNVVRFERTKIVPAGVALITSECIQNLRSSLDHIVFALAQLYHGGPLPESIASRTKFPIFHCQDAFEREQKRRIGDIDPDAQAAIKRLQPYHGRNGYGSDPLWLLNELSRIDKHRTLIGVISVPHAPVPPDQLFSPVWSNPLTVDPTKREAEILHYLLREHAPPVHMNFDSFVKVTFAEGPAVGQEIVPRLKGFRNYIRGPVLGNLAPFLGFGFREVGS